MRTLFSIALLFGLACTAACGHSDTYKTARYDEHKLETDAYNCRWDLTHEADGKGGYTVKEVDEEALKAEVKKCLEAKGYDFSAPKKTEDEGSWWWPF